MKLLSKILNFIMEKDKLRFVPRENENLPNSQSLQIRLYRIFHSHVQSFGNQSVTDGNF